MIVRAWGAERYGRHQVPSQERIPNQILKLSQIRGRAYTSPPIPHPFE